MPPRRRRRPKGGDPEYPYLYKRYGNKTVRSRYPVFTHAWSKQQKVVRKRLREASHYAVAVAADPAAVAYYTALIRRKKKRGQWTVRNAAMADFLNPAAIEEVALKARRDPPGFALSAYAHQKFAVMTVTVELRRGPHVLHPERPAQYNAPLWTCEFPIPLPAGDDWEAVLVATTRPGNRTVLTVPASALRR